MEKLFKEKEEAIKNIQTSTNVVSLAVVPITRVSTTTTSSAIRTIEGAEHLTKAI